jgi:hypothetical protein
MQPRRTRPQPADQPGAFDGEDTRDAGPTDDLGEERDADEPRDVPGADDLWEMENSTRHPGRHGASRVYREPMTRSSRRRGVVSSG